MTNYYIQKQDELYHYGVKGMKWGVRRYQKSSGALTKEGYAKYYTNGRINAAGKKARSKAQKYQSVGKGNLGRQVIQTATTASLNHWLFGRGITNFIHSMGNRKITKMGLNGASANKKKAVAAAYIAAMGAYTVAEYSNMIATTYVSARYKFDRTYKNRIDARANLKGYEKQQRESAKANSKKK